jgi:hypothetical protein
VPSKLGVIWRTFFSLTVALALLVEQYLPQFFKETPDKFVPARAVVRGFPLAWAEYSSMSPRFPSILWFGLIIDLAFWSAIAYLGISVIMGAYNKVSRAPEYPQ